MSSSPSDLDNRFAGQTLVFSGRLASLTRKEAQALVQRLGGATADEVTAKTTLLVLGAAESSTTSRPTPQAGDDAAEKTRKLRRAEQVNAAGAGAIRIVAEQEFCRLAGLPPPDAITQQSYSVREILGMYPGIREDHVRYLAKWGLVRPVARTNAGAYYAFADLGVIRQVHADLQKGLTFRSALRGLIATRHGQLSLDFRGGDSKPARIFALERPAKSSVSSGEAPRAYDPGVDDRDAAIAAFGEAFASDDGAAETQDVAADGYRRALMIDPSLVPALVNLANIHYAREHRIEAQALYERAISIEPHCFEAHFNLGHVFHDLGRFHEAEACYRQTLGLNPAYAEAHFYLAVTLEKMGRSQDAKPHWRTYQQLAPEGEWVELAREFSD